jgi:hypothetical protein
VKQQNPLDLGLVVFHHLLHFRGGVLPCLDGLHQGVKGKVRVLAVNGVRLVPAVCGNAVQDLHFRILAIPMQTTPRRMIVPWGKYNATGGILKTRWPYGLGEARTSLGRLHGGDWPPLVV